MRLKKRGKRLASAKDNIEASASSVASMSAPHRGDPGRVAGNRQPVVNCRPDSTPFERRLAPSLMTRDQEQDPVARGDRSLQRPVDRLPGAVQAVAVEVQRAIRLDPSRPQPLVPASVKRGRLKSFGPNWIRFSRPNRRNAPLGVGHRDGIGGLAGNRHIDGFARQRADGRGDLRPQGGFFRGELAHAPPCPWGGGSTPAPWPTFRRQSLRRLSQLPRRCRSDWRP